MSLVRLLPAWLHAIADYAVAFTLIAAALIVGGSGEAVAAGVVIGAVVLVVSMLTRYPLGVIKVLPFKVHSAGDYLAAALLLASPFALGFSSSDGGLTALYIGSGVAVLAVSLITNYQYGPQRQLAAAKAEGGDFSQGFAAPSSSRQPVTTAPLRTESTAPATMSSHGALIEQAAARWPAFPASA